MTRDEKRSLLLNIVNEILEDEEQEPVKALTDDMSLRNDIGFDSMGLAIITAKLESELDVDVFEDGVVDTIGEVLDKL